MQTFSRLPLPSAYLDPAFRRCLEEAAGTPELIANFNRLYGATIGSRSTAIEKLIDDTTGKTRDDMREFVRFVHDCVYSRLPADALEALRFGRACLTGVV